MIELEGKKILKAMTENEETVKQAANIKTPEDFVVFAKKADVNVTIDDAKMIMEKATELHDSDELDESVLELVNGGFGVATFIIVSGCLLLVACIYAAIGLMVLTNKK